MADDRVLSVKCPNCGSMEIAYNADEKKLQCAHCRHTWDLPREKDKILEQKLGEGFSLAEMPRGLGLETKVFNCKSCGSNVAEQASTVNVSCPFCGSTQMNEQAMNTNVILPSGVLPFAISHKTALESFKNWIGEGWFRPNDLAAISRLDKIRGVYLPFWTYDAMTESTWRAEAGFYYYETVSYTDSEGNRQTRQEQRTRWEWTSGYLEHFFDDVLVVASKGLSQGVIDDINPFNLNDVVNYDSQYVLGWDCEVYQKDIKEGFKDADKIMDGQLYQLCASRIPGDTYRNLQVSTRKSALTFKHLLLPIWIAAYTYQSKIYQFVVNGQTGKISGDKPYSAWKIVIAILVAILLIGLAVYFFQLYQEPPHATPNPAPAVNPSRYKGY
jgi:predicted RNA-binding Zn-ribbon protein involved in translation (DUF1610 family)